MLEKVLLNNFSNFYSKIFYCSFITPINRFINITTYVRIDNLIIFMKIFRKRKLNIVFVINCSKRCTRDVNVSKTLLRSLSNDSAQSDKQLF